MPLRWSCWLSLLLGAASGLACSAQAPDAARTPANPPIAPAAVSAAEREPMPSASAPAAAEPAVVAWSYRAGAPLAAPPGIGEDGTVALGSVDGYLHSLRADGSFRWGYTLRGPLVGRPAIGQNGSVFAAADPNGLYALDPDGTLRWVSSVVGGVCSSPVVDAQRRVWVSTGQGVLLGFSERGGIVGFARVGPAPTVGPTLLREGGVAIASANGDVRIAGHPGSKAHALANAPVLALEAGKDSLFVVAAAGLSRFDPAAGEERWSRVDVARVACSEPLVVAENQRLRWLSPQGEPLAEVLLSIGSQRPVACLPDGSLLVVDDAGALVRVERSGIRGRAMPPAGRLVSLDPASGGTVIAGYRDGRVLALRPPG